MLKILIVKLSAIGDVVHCLPVAAALKKALPDVHVSWVVDKGSAELLVDNQCVDEVIVFDGKLWSREGKNPANWFRVGTQAFKFFKQLRAKRFDVALEMQGLFKSGVLAMASGAPIRMGFDGTREFAESFLTHRVNVGDYFGHEVPVVELNLKIVDALLAQLGKPPRTAEPEFSLPATTDEVWQKVTNLISSNSLDSSHSANSSHSSNSANSPYIRNEVKGAEAFVQTGAKNGARTAPLAMPSVVGPAIAAPRYCVLVPGTTWVTKIWPDEYWYQLGEKLIERFDYKLLIIGAKSEVETNKQLNVRLNAFRDGAALDLTSKTSLLDLAAIFRVVDLVIGGDTGPLHLAAAVGAANVVGIYGSTPWKRNGPYGQKCRSVSLSLDCQPCYAKQCNIQTVDCLRNLGVDQVIESIVELGASQS